MGYRAIRGPSRRVEGTPDGTYLADRSQAAPDPVEALVGPDGFWICGTCHSVNRREAHRCYGCRAARDAAATDVPSDPPATGWVPVMADNLVRSAAVSGSLAHASVDVAENVRAAAGVAVLGGSAGDPAAPPATAASVGSAPPRERRTRAPRPVAAQGERIEPRAAQTERPAARTERPAARTKRPAAQTKKPAAQTELPAETADGVGSPVGALVCPFLGWKDDPSTRFDFPDAANRCHATAERVPISVGPGTGFARPAGRGRSRTVDAEHQRTHCLTAAHRGCARYPAVEAAAAHP